MARILYFAASSSIDSEGDAKRHFGWAKALELAVVTEVVGLSIGEGKAVAEREIGGGAPGSRGNANALCYRGHPGVE